MPSGLAFDVLARDEARRWRAGGAPLKELWRKLSQPRWHRRQRQSVGLPAEGGSTDRSRLLSWHSCSSDYKRAAEAPSLRRSLLARGYTAGFLPSLPLSLSRVLRGVRSSAARSAIAAGSSIRSGSPCRSRERRAPFAPALRIAILSSVHRGPRGARRTSRRLPL